MNDRTSHRTRTLIALPPMLSEVAEAAKEDLWAALEAEGATVATLIANRAFPSDPENEDVLRAMFDALWEAHPSEQRVRDLVVVCEHGAPEAVLDFVENLEVHGAWVMEGKDTATYFVGPEPEYPGRVSLPILRRAGDRLHVVLTIEEWTGVDEKHGSKRDHAVQMQRWLDDLVTYDPPLIEIASSPSP